MNTNDARAANLLGAAALHVTGRIRAAVSARATHGGMLADAVVVIKDQPGCTVDWLGRALGLSQPGAVHLVTKLVGLGWVDKRAGMDGRSRALHLTAPGRRAATEILTARQAVLADLLAGLTPQQRDQLATIAEQLLTPAAPDDRALAHVCRLCDRSCCSRCPAHQGYLERL